MMITKLMYTIHRVLGTLLSILFLVWFLSAFVMMYHGFPRASQAEKLEKLEPLSPSLPSVGEITSRLPEGESERNPDRPIPRTDHLHIRTDKGEHNLPADSAQVLPSVDGSRIRRTASLWCSAPVERIDTLNRLDQWVPFGSLKKSFPFISSILPMRRDTSYTSAHKVEKYCSSPPVTNVSGHGWGYSTLGLLHLAPARCRFMERHGDLAVGHWLPDDDCRTVGRYRHLAPLTQTGKRFLSLSQKWYHWHYVTGIVFGLFVLTFCFSGMMSLAEVPS